MWRRSIANNSTSAFSSSDKLLVTSRRLASRILGLNTLILGLSQLELLILIVRVEDHRILLRCVSFEVHTRSDTHLRGVFLCQFVVYGCLSIDTSPPPGFRLFCPGSTSFWVLIVKVFQETKLQVRECPRRGVGKFSFGGDTMRLNR